jgi:hypothetical protein
MSRFIRFDGVSMVYVHLVPAAGPEVTISIPEAWLKLEEIQHMGVSFVRIQKFTDDGKPIFVEF